MSGRRERSLFGELFCVLVLREGKIERSLGAAIPIDSAAQRRDLYNSLAPDGFKAVIRPVSIQIGEQFSSPTPSRLRRRSALS